MSVAFRSANERHFRVAKGDNGTSVLRIVVVIGIFCYAVSVDDYVKALVNLSFLSPKKIC